MNCLNNIPCNFSAITSATFSTIFHFTRPKNNMIECGAEMTGIWPKIWHNFTAQLISRPHPSTKKRPKKALKFGGCRASLDLSHSSSGKSPAIIWLRRRDPTFDQTNQIITDVQSQSGPKGGGGNKERSE